MIRDTAVATSRELLDVLEARGVKNFFVSPGSRNTPLLIGLEARSNLRKFIINDERTAAFAALGYSLASKQPVALVCTSGTALYNYAPAIAEAFYQHIPIIVITADRPSQWIDQDDSQTLKQYGALQKIVKRSFDIHADAGSATKCASNLFASEMEWYANRVANEAVTEAQSAPSGPVHVNMQFADSLSTTVEKDAEPPRIVETIRGENILSKTTLCMLAERLATKRVLVVAGYMQPDSKLNRALTRFAALPNVAIMCETISNLHLEPECHMIDSLLTHINDEELKELHPDVVITIGGALISRLLKEFLRHSDITQHWAIAETPISADCMQRLSLHIDANPARFFSGLAGVLSHHESTPAFGYRDYVRGLREKAMKSADEYIRASTWSELKALDIFFRKLPLRYNLFISNGTCIRYAQLLTTKMPHACYCNRGVSGIDGGNATALGAALAYKGTTLLLTGDMSFSYCPEILQLVNQDADLRIVVVNNSGGGIFRFIKTTRDLDIREQYFCSDPKLPLRQIANAYGWVYLRACNEQELEISLDKLFETPRSILEIRADAQLSAETLIKYLKNDRLENRKGI